MTRLTIGERGRCGTGTGTGTGTGNRNRHVMPVLRDACQAQIRTQA
ncbi:MULTISPECIES: hypothetical protein [unclassified Xanthomonas]|nr:MULTISPECIES: hypothetical protein [unclassified Xanthomonas]